MMPFYDSHAHLCGYGLSLSRPDIGRSRSFAEAVATVIDSMKGHSRDILVASNFDETAWEEKRLPTLYELDRAFPDTPVIFRRVCGHIAVANTMALERIGDEWKTVHRDTGLLEEDVVLRINEAVGVSDAQTLEGARRGIAEAHSKGVAGVGEVCSLQQFNALRRLTDESMAMRVAAFLPPSDAGRALDSGIKPGKVVGNLHFRGVKVFLDGSLGGRTAALSSDYADAPGARGLLLMTDEALAREMRACEDSGLQLMMHAIGDRAIAQALHALEHHAADGNPLGHRIEHAEVMDQRAIARAKAAGARLSLQPNFAGRWSGVGGMNWTRLGQERHRWCNPYRSIVDAGVPCAFGSDCMPLDPLFGIRSAVGHPIEEERIGGDVAIRLYSAQSARFLGFENAGKDSLELTCDLVDEGCRIRGLTIDGRRVV